MENEFVNKNIKNNLKYLRNEIGKSQDDIGKIVNKGNTTISNWEKGIRSPDAVDLALLANYFSISVDDLINKDLRFKDNNLENISLQKEVVKIPVLGTIPAGIPIEMIEDIIGYEEIPKDWLRGGNKYFGLKIKGDSMSPKYLDGDTVIFKQSPTCDNGDECALTINNYEATFKKVLRHEQGITIQPLNPLYEIKLYSNEEIENLPIKILGIAKELRRKL